MNCFEYGVQAQVLDLPMTDEKSELAKAKHVKQSEQADQRALRKLQDDREPGEVRIGTRLGRSGSRMARRGGY
jgi:hypothetical protein